MSTYYSKWALNTYAGTPYFRAQVPEGFPLYVTLQKCRAFRRLPQHIKELARLAKRWAEIHDLDDDLSNPDGINRWYDAEGNELNPRTGVKLTDAEVDAQWLPDPSLDHFVVIDIPVPIDGFPDPDAWEPVEQELEDDDDDKPSPAQIKLDIKSRGYRAAQEIYGLPDRPQSFAEGESPEVTKAAFAARVSRVMHSPYFDVNPPMKPLLESALQMCDIYEDLGGQALDVFDIAEAWME